MILAFYNDLAIHFTENKYSPGWYWITIHSVKAQKHLAIKNLLAIIHRENHEVIVFGDNINDISMFMVADRSYAVSNAKEEIKELAKRHNMAKSQSCVKYFCHHQSNCSSNLIKYCLASVASTQ